MKIPGSIRRLHGDLHERYAPLRSEVDEILRHRKRETWHYESRLKSEESFALKLESGRWKESSKVDDLLGALLVVENFSVLQSAECLVGTYFDIVRRRPSHPRSTTTRADSFPFDDLRLYVQWRSDSPIPKPQYDDLIFEIQLRTFLQHAWNVATHDIVYKSNIKEWPKERVAAQVRASLEHAEITLHEIDTLAKSNILFREDPATRRARSIARLLQEQWDRARLPDDVKRLATNVQQMIETMDISVARLRKILEEESRAGRGPLTENLSPFGTLVQSLIYQEPKAMLRLLRTPHRGFTIWMPSELHLPEEFDPSRFRDVFNLSS